MLPSLQQIARSHTQTRWWERLAVRRISFIRESFSISNLIRDGAISLAPTFSSTATPIRFNSLPPRRDWCCWFSRALVLLFPVHYPAPETQQLLPAVQST